MSSLDSLIGRAIVSATLQHGWLTLTLDDSSTLTVGPRTGLAPDYGVQASHRWGPAERGRTDCMQDSFENCPFASIGGLAARDNPQAPRYIPEAFRRDYLDAYAEAARALFGHDWRTCSFEWRPALTIGEGQ